jgi:hypothetical protein
LPNGAGYGVVKDSWISCGRASEANFLKHLCIPFGPQLLNHCVLGNTSPFRQHPIDVSEFPKILQMCREKWRILTYPAGIHISNFVSLWELMVALLDIVVCMINFISLLTTLLTLTYFLAILYLESHQKVHRDISYTNILLRDPEVDSTDSIREELMTSLDLSDIVKLRHDLDCREGLLIDFDYGASLSGQKDIGVPVEGASEGDGIVEALRQSISSFPPQEAGGSTGGNKNDGTEAPTQSVSSFPPQAPSGSRTVRFSQFQSYS